MNADYTHSNTERTSSTDHARSDTGRTSSTDRARLSTGHDAPEGPTLKVRSRAKSTLRRGAFFALAIVLGFLLLELPWNDGVFSIPLHYAIDNLLILGLVCAIVFLAGQRTRASLAAFVGLCLLGGVANFFIITFKGQPIVPADLFALSTAASVAGGYELFLTGCLAFCLAAYAAFCVALAKLCPKRQRARWDGAANVLAAALLVCLGVMQYQTVDIKRDCGVTVDVWDVRGSYATQGTALCFLSRAQELTPTPPEGYSPEAVNAILAPFAADPLTKLDASAASASSSVNAQAPAAPEPSPANASADSEDAATSKKSAAAEHPEALPYDGPNVIAIMNETFSNLSSYPGLESTNAAPTFFNEVADDALAAGDVFVSAMGGGTCNSEFEFLTGASMGNMGGGVYPYVLYDLEGVDNLASYFRALGYGTHAIHPAEAANWRRDRIYEQLGFDTFDDITTMEGADTFRDLVTDRATYERALEKIDADENPQFVFDVTIQNHGGYDTGLVPPADTVHLDATAVESPEVDEFLAAIRRSDEDLHWLVDELNARNEPVIVVFFGDHQPGFADWLFEETFGKPVEDANLEEVQARYRTPYFIWANAAARGKYGDSLARIENADVTSLNYLSTLLLDATGLPRDSRALYRSALRQALPAVNLNGYRDAEGAWHWFGEAVETDAQKAADDALKSYGIVQYDQLFGNHSNR